MQTRIRTVTVSLIFIAMLVLGIAIFPDYGLSVDEEACRYRAIVTAKYMTELVDWHVIPDNVPLMANYVDRDHGVFFDLVAFGIEKLLGLEDTQSIYTLKHLLNYLIFLAGVASIYRIAERRFNSWFSGLLAAIFLFLSPRIFADAFTNPKDLVFMSMFVIAVNTAMALIVEPSGKRAVLHALATALAVDTRVMGIVLVPTTLFILFFKIVNRSLDWRKALKTVVVYMSATALFIVIFWPMLWSDPIRNFLHSFTSMSNFVRWEKEVLLMGRFIMSNDLPWYYSLVWIAVSTPILYLLLFLAGIIYQVKNLVLEQQLKFWKNDRDLQDVFVLILFAGPIASVVILESIMYDGWRHIYFVYPAFLILAVGGFNWIYTWAKEKSKFSNFIFAAVIAASLLNTGIWMIRAHPLQNVYFNVLAGSNWKENYDLDYWGLANREALEYVTANDPSSRITISTVSASSVAQSFLIIDAADRSRLVFIDYSALPDSGTFIDGNPLYVFNNYKRLKDPDLLDRDENFELFYKRQVAGETILTVYKRSAIND